jgi:hypothetical protein
MHSDAESIRLHNLICGAVQKVEQTTGVAPDDPAIVELKHSVVRAVVELELEKAKRQDKAEP